MGVRDETDGKYNFIDAGIDLKYSKDKEESSWKQIACVVTSERVKKNVTCENADDECEYVDDWYGQEDEEMQECQNK